MKKIIITKNQLKLITEALGVPDNILEAADMLYDVVERNIKSINTKQDEYTFDGNIRFELGDKKKVKIDSYKLTVNLEKIDGEEGVLDIVQMTMGGFFGFDRDKFMKQNQPSSTLELIITFAVGDNWRPKELIKKMEEERDEHVSSLAHEIKHKYDKQSKLYGLIGPDAEYQAIQKRGTFGIPVLDTVFFRYMYYISGIENLVRPTEVAYSMKRKNITKSQFREFLENNRVYKELLEIKNFTYDDFINQLKGSEDRLNALLEHIGEEPSEMNIDEKINKVLEVAYIDLVNNKMELFINMTEHESDIFLEFAESLGILTSDVKERIKELQKTNEIRQKFLKYVTKYQDNPKKFFEVEIEKFNYVSTKMLKKIGKLYAMAKDDESQVNESILNWDLYQKIMEKKYGKRKISTTYKY